jgi:hypothetical protein
MHALDEIREFIIQIHHIVHVHTWLIANETESEEENEN